MGGGTSALLVALLVVGLAPHALAASGRVELSSAEAMRVDADLVARAEGGSAILSTRDGAASAELRNVTGRLTLYTWTRTELPIGSAPPADLKEEPFDLRGGALSLASTRGLWELRVNASEGALTLDAGRVEATGAPVFLTQPYLDRQATTGPRFVAMAWQAGWAFLGEHAPPRAPALVGFPPVDAGTLHVDGRVLLQAFGGRATFVDADGRRHAVDLGELGSDASLPGGLAEAKQVRRLVLEATVGDADVPLPDAWALAAPAIGWRVDGDLQWTRATGEAVVDGQRRAFADADVRLELDGDVAPDAPPVAALPDRAYAAEGDVRDLRVDGARVASPAPARASSVAAAATGLALLLLLLTKAGQALVAGALASLATRISPSNALDQPARRRFYELVRAEPGIHQREAQRRLGLAWGTFSFHLQRLEKSGHVRVVKQGAYATLFPAAIPLPGVVVGHPTARSVYDALPLDGAPVPVPTLAAQLGHSRELVNYHLRSLEDRGLVRRVLLEDGRRAVARANEPRS